MAVDWADVYRRNFDDLVRFLHRMVWDVDRARDLAQDAFARALNQAPDNPRAWLFRVASNLANDEARTAIRRRKHLVLIKSEAQAKQASIRDPQDELEQKERIASVKAALEQLAPKDREALLLWDAGLNYKDIAAATGLAQSAVGTTLARARRRLVEAHAVLENRHVAH